MPATLPSEYLAQVMADDNLTEEQKSAEMTKYGAYAGGSDGKTMEQIRWLEGATAGPNKGPRKEFVNKVVAPDGTLLQNALRYEEREVNGQKVLHVIGSDNLPNYPTVALELAANRYVFFPLRDNPVGREHVQCDGTVDAQGVAFVKLD